MSKKSKSTTEPSKFAKGYITQGANALQGAYSQNAGKIQGATDQVMGLLPSMLDRYQAGDPALTAANDYSTRVLGGEFLNNNPHLQGMIDATNNDVMNQSQAAMGLRGLTGGSSYADLISRNLARNTTNLRYTDYANERAAMDAAANRAPGLVAADSARVAPILSTLQAGTMPLQAAQGYAGGLGGLLGGYASQTNKAAPFDSAMQGIGTALSAAALFSDERLKEDVREVGMTDGGLPVYTYRYKGDPTTHMGVMAQDVEKKQPSARGPNASGYKTVNYGKVR